MGSRMDCITQEIMTIFYDNCKWKIILKKLQNYFLIEEKIFDLHYFNQAHRFFFFLVGGQVVCLRGEEKLSGETLLFMDI